MRIIFSRKGFDSAAGKAPSPIMEGEPISLPIPTERRSETSYRLAWIGEIVEHVTKGRIGADNLCHEDPVFLNGVGPSGRRARRKRIWKRTASMSAMCFFSSACLRRATAKTAIIGYSDTWKSMKCADLAANLLRAIIPKDSFGDIRIRSESGTRTTRFTSAQGPRRGAPTLPASYQVRCWGFRVERSGMAQSGRPHLS
jgi:hypothetical protein